jgi:uncharacterized membrane protein YdjX (TVP38/TMEM64 family)
MQRLKTKGFWQGVLSIVLFGVMIYTGAYFVGTTDVQERVNQAGLWAPLVFIGIKASTIIFAPLNGAPVYLVGSHIFGFKEAFAYLFLGDFVGFSVVFYISRHFGKRILKKMLTTDQYNQIEKFLIRTGNWKGLAITRISFPGFADIISYGVGLTHIPYWQYILVTIPFILANVTIMLTLGASFIDSIKSYLILIALFVVGSFAIVQIKNIRKKRKAQAV